MEERQEKDDSEKGKMTNTTALRLAVVIAIAAGALGAQTPAAQKTVIKKPSPALAPGTDIQDLIQRLTARGAAKSQTEFETTEQYDARAMSLLRDFDREYRFVMPHAYPDFQYSAEERAMGVSVAILGFPLFQNSSERQDSIVLKSVLKNHRKFIGSNAFGASRIVTSDLFDEYGIIFAKGSPVPPNSVRMVIPMDATLAESVEPSLRLVLTGKLTNSHVYGGSDYSGATLDEPAEITTYKYYLLAMVEKVELVDGRSGKVFASTDEGATRTFVPSPAGAR